jgi:hypothetical protein
MEPKAVEMVPVWFEAMEVHWTQLSLQREVRIWDLKRESLKLWGLQQGGLRLGGEWVADNAAENLSSGA